MPALQLVDTPEAGPFAEGWRAIREAGGFPVVLQVGGKAPLWTNWHVRPLSSEKTLAATAGANRGANIGVSCGPSRVTVLDLDTKDRTLVRYVLETYGETPLIVSTPRGFHLYYRSMGERSGSFRDHPDASLRRHPIDVKGIGGQVVAPPSVRPEGEYEFHRCRGWVRFAELPTLSDEGRLVHLRGRSARSANVRRLHNAASESVGEGGRNIALFRHLLRLAAPLSNAPAPLIETRVRTLAREFIDTGAIDREDGHRFSDDEISRTIGSVVRLTAQGRNWNALSGGTLGKFRSDVEALHGDGDAYLLLSFLRQHHAVGSPFAIAARSMAAHQVIPRWGEKRYRSALGKLLGGQRLRRVRRGGRGPGDPSYYEFF